jgi:hypothetical protein
VKRGLAKTNNKTNDDRPTFVYANPDPNKSGSKTKSLYSWGFTSTGALGDEKYVRLENKRHQNIVKPTLVKFYNNMKVSANQLHLIKDNLE